MARRRRERCLTPGCTKPPNDLGVCDDCELAQDLEILDATIMDLLRPIPPTNNPRQIAAAEAAAKVMRRTFRVVN